MNKKTEQGCWIERLGWGERPPRRRRLSREPNGKKQQVQRPQGRSSLESSRGAK